MPVRRKSDSRGPYYQYGESGAKYHYKANDEESRKRAYEKAKKQERAILAGGYRGK